MSKDPVYCRECLWCESLPGSRWALCWKRKAGPTVIDALVGSWCEDQLKGDEDEIIEGVKHLRGRDIWRELHGNSRERLGEVLLLLKLAAADPRAGASLGVVGEAIEELQKMLSRQACNESCPQGPYPRCEELEGTACSNMSRAREIWGVLRLLRGETAVAAGEGQR